MNNQTKVSPIFFNPEKLGASMKEVGTDYLQLESREIETRWFRDNSGEIDIFIWLNKDKKIIKQQVSIMGLLTEWNSAEGIKTGVALENELQKQNLEDTNDQQRTSSEIIHFDKTIQPKNLMMAMQLLEKATCIEEPLKKTMLALFAQGTPIGVKLYQMESRERFGGAQESFTGLKSIFHLILQFLSRIKRCFKK